MALSVAAGPQPRRDLDFPGRVAVLIPCYNEAASIGRVVRDFKMSLPHADIYVYDNNSTDRTVEIAEAAGAVVRRVWHQGKGSVVRRMFSDVEADVYVMVDGDDTYTAADAPALVTLLLQNHFDMVVGTRVATDEQAFRFGHQWGNWVFTRSIGLIFGDMYSDILSGYRVFSRRFVKSFPALSNGFDTEAEMTVHALELKMPVGEMATGYRGRPTGSSSKLNTYRDGVRILIAIMALVKAERPILFFGTAAGLLIFAAVILMIPVVLTYEHTGLVPRVPTVILSTGLVLSAFLSLTSGLILDTITRGRREMKRLFYLSLPWLSESRQTSGSGESM